MDIRELKLTEQDFMGKDVASLSNTPSDDGMTAEELKAWFDKLPKMLALDVINLLIDTLASKEGAQNIGLNAQGVDAANVKDGIAELRATTYDRAQVNERLGQKADADKVLTKDNTELFIPAGDYQPATKYYVDRYGAAGSVTQVYVDERDEVIRSELTEAVDRSKARAAAITLPVGGWETEGEGYRQTVTVPGLLANDCKHEVAVNDASYTAYNEAAVRPLFVVNDNELIFVAEDVPEMDVEGHILQTRVGGEIGG